MTTPVAMATNRSYSKTKLATADIVTSHIIFSLHQLFYSPGSIPKTVNKFIIVKSNTKNLDKIRLKTAKIRAKNFNSLQSYVRAIWVKTRKQQKIVLGWYYRVLNSRLAFTRLAILNTWNKNTKTEVASRNNVVHQSLLTSRTLQWMLMPMVERHV